MSKELTALRSENTALRKIRDKYEDFLQNVPLEAMWRIYSGEANDAAWLAFGEWLSANTPESEYEDVEYIHKETK